MGIKSKVVAKSWVKSMPTVIFAVGMMFFTMYLFYPGIINPDSEYQLLQAHAFKFSDWHPPVMSFLWFLLNHIYDGTPVMLVFHNLVFWAAAFLLAFWIAPKSNYLRISFLLFFGFFPTILSQLGMVVKDTAMSVSLFLSSVLLLYAELITTKVKQLTIVMIVLIFLFYGFAVRLNAAPAVLVLGIWLGEVVFRKSWWCSILFGLGLVVLFFGCNQVITKKILHAEKTYPIQQVQIHDLAGISLTRNKPMMPKYVLSSNLFTSQQLYRDYDPANVRSLIFEPRSIVGLTSDPVKICELNKVWWQAIHQYPFDYLKHRAKVFAYVLLGSFAFSDDICRISFTNFNYYPGFIYQTYCNSVFNGVFKILFHSWIYIINSIVIALVAVYFRRQFLNFRPIMYLVVSGLLYVVGLFFSAPACEFRYVYWEVMASLMALSLLIKNILKGSSSNN